MFAGAAQVGLSIIIKRNGVSAGYGTISGCTIIIAVYNKYEGVETRSFVGWLGVVGVETTLISECTPQPPYYSEGICSDEKYSWLEKITEQIRKWYMTF